MSYPPPLPQQPHDPYSGGPYPPQQPYDPYSGGPYPPQQPQAPYSGGPYPPQQPQVYQQFYPPVVIAQAPPTSGWSVAALVFGIFGVLGGFCLLGIPCIVAVVCGHVGLSETRNGSRSGRGLAIAGLVMGYVLLVPAIVFLFFGGIGAVIGSITPTVTPTP